jgi:hypothetical protein
MRRIAISVVMSAAVAAVLLPVAAAAGNGAKTVTIEVDGHPTTVYVDSYLVGVDECTTAIRAGERVRVVPERSPRRCEVTWRMDYRHKSHMVDEEEGAFPLVYRYADEDRLRFVRDGNKWYRADGDRRTLVAISLLARKDKPALPLPENEIAGLPCLYVRVHADHVASVLPKLKGIKSLGLHIPYVTAASLEALEGMDNLKLLHIYGPHENHGRVPSTLETVEPLAALTSLEVLNMEGSEKVTDISPLGALVNLEALELSCCNALKDISVLGKLKNLTALSLPPSTTNEQLATVCAEHPGLRSLEVRYATGLSDVSPVAKLASLERLSLIFSGPVTDVAPLAGMKQLRAFGMPVTAKPEEAFAAICSGLTGLRTLSLTGSGVKDLAPVAGLTSLEVLHRGRVLKKRRGMTGLSGVAGLKELRFIRLYNAYIENLSPLSGLTKLKAISMTGSKAKDLTALKDLTDIEYLCFYGDKELKTLDGVQNMKKLVRMALRGAGVEDMSALATTPIEYVYVVECTRIKSLKELIGIKTLKRLHGLGYAKLGEEGKAFKKARPDVRTK